jgi:hypothetical protein
LLLGHVGLVKHDDYWTTELSDLRSEEEITEQVRRVDDEYYRIRTTVAGDVTRQRVDDDLLVGRSGGERVKTGEVDELDLLAVAEVARAGLAGDGHAWVITDALAQPGECVEECRLAGVRVTDERDQ